MVKDLNWKTFEAHDDQDAYGKQLFIDLTMEQRLERFFALLEIRSELSPKVKEVDPSVFNLSK